MDRGNIVTSETDTTPDLIKKPLNIKLLI